MEVTEPGLSSGLAPVVIAAIATSVLATVGYAVFSYLKAYKEKTESDSDGTTDVFNAIIPVLIVVILVVLLFAYLNRTTG